MYENPPCYFVRLHNLVVLDDVVVVVVLRYNQP